MKKSEYKSYYDRQLEELELATERQRVVNLLLEQKSPA